MGDRKIEIALQLNINIISDNHKILVNQFEVRLRINDRNTIFKFDKN